MTYIVLRLLLLDGTDAYSAVAFVLAMLFLAIANVLLLNVLVALFKYVGNYVVIKYQLIEFSFASVTIQNVENQSHQLWRYQRFLIVFEYSDKPPLPPPFNLIYYLYRVIRFLIEKTILRCRRRRDGNSDDTGIRIHVSFLKISSRL